MFGKDIFHSFSHGNRDENLHWEATEAVKDHRAGNSAVGKECFLSFCVLTGEFYL